MEILLLLNNNLILEVDGMKQQMLTIRKEYEEQIAVKLNLEDHEVDYNLDQ